MKPLSLKSLKAAEPDKSLLPDSFIGRARATAACQPLPMAAAAAPVQIGGCFHFISGRLYYMEERLISQRAPTNLDDDVVVVLLLAAIKASLAAADGREILDQLSQDDASNLRAHV